MAEKAEKTVQGVMIRFADPKLVTKWWVVCERKKALDEIGSIVYFHRDWFVEHGLLAEWGMMEGDSFIPSETIDTSGVKLK